MEFGPRPPRQLPQQDPAKVMLLAERWQRASYAHSIWAGPAKECVDMLEGRHWTADQLAKMPGRAAFKFNIIAPLVRLVLGYQANNSTDITFSPSDDSLSNEEVADTLTAIEKSIAKGNLLEFVDGEVFMDGLAGGRGWYDTRLDFKNNDLGEIRTKGLDPFTVKPDPDADTYDLNESAAFMQVDRMVSLDEIESNLGRNVADLVRPWTMGQTPIAPLTSVVMNDVITPVRYFGQREDTTNEYWDSFYSLMGDFVDRHRKTIRAIETQYKVREMRNVYIDLETGDKKALPDHWNKDKIEKVLLYAELNNNPAIVERRLVERIHWTTLVGDLIIYDAPSLYDAYTMVGYFPYFRRGTTRGMVEDLVDPQKEKNKRRNARIETDTRTANGGWSYHQESLDPVQERKLQKFGSMPGFTLKWKGQHEPKQLTPAQPNVGAQRLESDADEDVHRISGVSREAMGQVDTVQSGRALEAKQRQSVIAVQLYMSNFRRSKQLVGHSHLGVIQRYYTEQRIFRVTGDDGKLGQVAINQKIADPLSGTKRIINDVTVGRYSAMIDEAPISKTFLAAQYEEMMELLEKLAPALGPNIGAFADLIISNTSMPRKEEWIERLQQILGSGGGQPPPAGGPPGGGGKPGPEPYGSAPPPAPGLIGAPLRAEPGGAHGNNVVPMPMRG